MKKLARYLVPALVLALAVCVLLGADFAAKAAAYTPGDVDGNGQVNTTDVILMRRHIAGGYSISINEKAADVDGNGQINTTDVILMRRYIAGGYGVNLVPGKEDEPEIYAKPIEEEHVKTGTLVYEGEEYEGEYIDNEIIVVADPSAEEKDILALFDGGAQVVGRIPEIGYWQVELAKTADIGQIYEICSSLTKNRIITDAYPNSVTETADSGEILDNGYRKITFTVEDTHGGFTSRTESGDLPWDRYDVRNWHLSYTKVDKARALIKDSQTVKIGIIDTMFDTRHEDLDLKDVFFVNNPFSDEDIVSEKPEIINTKDKDLFMHYAHGTHVAGIIGAKNNGIGIAGVCDNAELYGYTNTRGIDHKTITGIFQWETALATLAKKGCRVINYSMGITYDKEEQEYTSSSQSGAKELHDEIIALNNAGYDFLIVAGAGNGGKDARLASQFNYIKSEAKYADVHKKIIVVSSVWPTYIHESDGEEREYYYYYANALVETEGCMERMTTHSWFFDYHNFGSCVDILAPGSALSTVPKTNAAGFSPTGYSVLAGTSMATPIVSGTAGLLFSIDPDFTAEQVYDYIVNNANHCVDTRDCNVTDALLDAEAAVKAALSVAYGKCGDNLTWTLDTHGTLTISGTGPMWDWEMYDSPFHAHRDGKNDWIDTVIIKEGVTNIGNRAFVDCYRITSVTIPEGVTSIGEDAFCNCSLYEITIPSSMTSIGGWAFANCECLTEITIPEGVTSIEESVFSGCEMLTKITIPESVTSIGKEAFQYCTSLESITIPSGVTSIGNNAFLNCTSLESVTIPEGVTSIGDGAFCNCVLTSVTIPSSVTSIGETAFGNCVLTSVTIPEGVTSIGYGAFSGCKSLESITIPSSVTSIGNGVFWGCTSLESITIPSSVTSIGERTFMDCYSLTSITIPASVTEIGWGAFAVCKALTDVYYTGTKKEWEAVSIGSDNDPLTKQAVIHYLG